MSKKNKNVLIYLIKRLMEKKSFFGKLQVMKLMFLIDHFNPEKRRIEKKSLLNNKYYIYDLGPFSFEISEEFDKLKEKDLERKIELDESIRNKVDLIIEKFGGIEQRILNKKCMEMLGITIENKGRFLGFRVDEIVKNYEAKRS
jgi:hypothetical protein